MFVAKIYCAKTCSDSVVPRTVALFDVFFGVEHGEHLSRLFGLWSGDVEQLCGPDRKSVV